MTDETTIPPTDDPAPQPPGTPETVTGPPIDPPPAHPAPSETTPAETAPIESPPVGAAPFEAAPAEAAPVESPPFEAAPAEAAPVESPPVGAAPAEAAPVKSPQVEAAPAEVAPVKSPQVEAARVEVAPVELPPVEAAPVEAPQADAAPTEVAPVESPQVEAARVEVAPVELPQVEAAQVEAPQVEAAPTEVVPAPAPTAGSGGRGAGRPGGRPGSRPGRRPGGAGHQPRTSPAVVEPMVEPVDPTLWGRIDDDGTVYVRTGEGERAVGNWQAGDADAGLAHYGRRFDDFSTEIALLEARLAAGSGDPKASKQQAVSLREQVATLAAVGDLDTAAERLEVVIGAADQAIAGASQARSQARARGIAAKEALCVEAEALGDSNQWKTAGDRLKTIVEEWRQITGIDRKTDDALWKRFAKARDVFSRHRGAHFAELDKQRGAAKDVKEALIARALELSSSTEWGETAGAYRELMTEWKAAGRAPRDVEDALWDRFRAAQEAFFSRRNQTFSERDSEFDANAAVKEKLLLEASSIDPVKDLDAARATLRSIQERWEAAGKVPRERIRELDGRLRAVEDKVRSAEDSHWRRTDPETQARVAQFRARVDQFKVQAQKARVAGDERRAREADAQAEQWEQWLAAAENAVQT